MKKYGDPYIIHLSLKLFIFVGILQVLKLNF